MLPVAGLPVTGAWGCNRRTGWFGLGCGADGRQGCGKVVEDGGVWEAENRVAGGGEESFSLRIVRALDWREVNGTVELDDKATVGAAEIDDEWADGMLAAELQAGEAAIAQPGPEDLLGAGLARSQVAGGRYIVTMPWTLRIHTIVSQKFLIPNRPAQRASRRGYTARRS